MSCTLAEEGHGFMQRVLTATAEFHAEDDIVGDSTGMCTDTKGTWVTAKYGTTSVRRFVKLHILAHPRGHILAFAVTGYRGADIAQLPRMPRCVRDGTGVAAFDAIYGSREICRIIEESGRVPVIDPKRNASPRGFTAYARMIRRSREDPAGFRADYSCRALVESIFSVMKRRTGKFVRARSLPTRTVELFARVLCYNMAA